MLGTKGCAEGEVRKASEMTPAMGSRPQHRAAPPLPGRELVLALSWCWRLLAAAPGGLGANFQDPEKGCVCKSKQRDRFCFPVWVQEQ